MRCKDAKNRLNRSLLGVATFRALLTSTAGEAAADPGYDESGNPICAPCDSEWILLQGVVHWFNDACCAPGEGCYKAGNRFHTGNFTTMQF